MEKITADILERIFGDDVADACKWVREQLDTIAPSYADRPEKPLIHLNKSSAAEVRKHAEDLEKYEKEKEEWDKKEKKYKDIENATSWELEEYMKKQSGLYSSVPEKYRSKVYSHAWQEGHSNGYYEVYLHLQELVEIFE